MIRKSFFRRPLTELFMLHDERRLHTSDRPISYVFVDQTFFFQPHVRSCESTETFCWLHLMSFDLNSSPSISGTDDCFWMTVGNVEHGSCTSVTLTWPASLHSVSITSLNPSDFIYNGTSGSRRCHTDNKIVLLKYCRLLHVWISKRLYLLCCCGWKCEALSTSLEKTSTDILTGRRSWLGVNINWMDHLRGGSFRIIKLHNCFLQLSCSHHLRLTQWGCDNEPRKKLWLRPSFTSFSLFLLLRDAKQQTMRKIET